MASSQTADGMGVIRSSTVFVVLLLAVELRAQHTAATDRHDLIVVSGLSRTDNPPPLALDLGDGGFGSGEAQGARVAAPTQPGVVAWRSPGGALIRVGSAGVKVDFPSGRELMIDLGGRVHLREDGSATLGAPRGVDLLLGDGTRLSVHPDGASGRRAGLRSVMVTSRAGREQELWQASRRLREAGLSRGGRARARRGSSRRSSLELHVLGDGNVLYEVIQRGPLLKCQRVLCPVGRRRQFPLERTVILGDPLAKSLRKLPDYLPRKSSEYPEGPRAAAMLARMAPLLFPRGVVRQASHTVGERVVALGGGGVRLSVADGVNGVLFVRLTTARAAQPIAEWIIGRTANLHLVRQDAGEPNTPRYFQRSVPVELE